MTACLPVYAYESAITAIGFDKSKVVTVGNYSYIPLNLQGVPDSHSRTILTVLDSFQKTQGVKIISFQIEKEQYTGHLGASNWVYGIWVTHESSRTEK
jgi:hypothetical protein